MTAKQRDTAKLMEGLANGSIILTGYSYSDYGNEPGRIRAEFVVYPRSVEKNWLALSIKKVIFHDPATIVFWEDGTKTIVKCGENDIFDPEKGIAMAIAKKALGNEGNYYNQIKKWLPESGGYGCSDPFAGIISKAIDSVGRITAAFEDAAFEND